MKFSVSITTREDDAYLISLDTKSLPKDLQKLIPPQLEVIDINLIRLKGRNATSLHTLSEITEIIAQVFIENENTILYFYCDDMTEIPHTQKHILPQEYRSQLFSLLFERYIKRHGITHVHNHPVRINDVDGLPMIIHLFARDAHKQYVDIIKYDLITNWSKPDA